MIRHAGVVESPLLVLETSFAQLRRRARVIGKLFTRAVRPAGQLLQDGIDGLPVVVGQATRIRPGIGQNLVAFVATLGRT